MKNNLVELVSLLESELKKLQNLLELDQDLLSQQNLEQLEKSNVDKLTALNLINNCLKKINQHEDNVLVVDNIRKTQNPEIHQKWENITQSMSKIQLLIATNQKVVGASSAYYAHMFEAIINACKKDAEPVYEK